MEIIEKLLDNLNSVILGKEEVIKKVVIGLLANGHVLLEDVPGTGKTTLAKAVANSFNMTFHRIQFTPDVLPSDIIGVTVYDMETKKFEIKFGPIFTNILLADEINRATPKTQSALLEAMGEYGVTIEGKVYKLEKPFIVFATENPIEYEGTFPLPEAQLDRFLMRLSVGYPDRSYETKILQQEKTHELIENSRLIGSREDLLTLQESVKKVFIHPKIYDFIVDIASNIRTHKDVYLGISPRATIHLMKVSQARAFIEGRNFVIPDDVKQSVLDVVNHRIILKAEAKLRGKKTSDVVFEVLDTVKVPKDVDFENEIS
ncbi:MAG: MoxR family ATPase [Caldisericaceae bacterium]